MWRSWSKISSPTPKTSSSSDSPRRSTSIFRCSSFKDINTLNLNPNPKSSPSNSIFHRVLTANALLRQWCPRSNSNSKEEAAPSIVVYSTSLRVVRSTFQACRAVLSIFHGLRVAIDERDIAMDSRFMLELQERLGGVSLNVPRVFIGGRYIGGADEVLQMHEMGELKKLVQGLPPVVPGTCTACAGYKFVVCFECSGSHKIYSDKVGGFRSCTACNHNGLIRCPHCSSHFNPPQLSTFTHPNTSSS